MTIKELKMMFTEETKIEIMAFDEDNSISVGLTRLLLGVTSFAEIPIAIRNVQAVGENQIVTEIDMPVDILRAWKKYSDDYYNK